MQINSSIMDKVAVKLIFWVGLAMGLANLIYNVYIIIGIFNHTLDISQNPYGISGPYLLLFRVLLCIWFVFWIYSFYLWNKYDKKAVGLILLIFLNVYYLPFYSLRLKRIMKE